MEVIMGHLVEYTGIILLVIGFIVRYRYKRRQYYRRFEPFKQLPYAKFLMSNTVQEFTKFGYIFLIIVGGLLALSGYIINKDAQEQAHEIHQVQHGHYSNRR